MENKAYYGRGWSFPPEFTKGGEQVFMSADIEDIVQSLEIIFGTRLWERIMLEDFGASLMNYHFEPLTPNLIAGLKRMITNAVLYHEPRIQLNTITIDEDKTEEGLLLISLDFDLPSSNSRYNMVYPFYLTEGNQQ